MMLDVLVIGGGLAGLAFVLEAPAAWRIGLVTPPGGCKASSSYHARGGIAAVLAGTKGDDSLASHVQDTLCAGGGLSDASVVRRVVAEAPHCVERLARWGVPFSTETSSNAAPVYSRALEGGHSHARVIHAGDATGRAISTTLQDRLAGRRGLVRLPGHTLWGLLGQPARNSGTRVASCTGALLLAPGGHRLVAVATRTVVLATGGVAAAFQPSTHPAARAHEIGAGFVSAVEAGGRPEHMEFIQFHPTCFVAPAGETVLLTETLRGAGAVLLDEHGRRFAATADPRGELAPRDILARAIAHEYSARPEARVTLSAAHLPHDLVRSRFPYLTARLREHGLDLACDAIPVVPAAHYTCGGIRAGLDGTTGVSGLRVIGEAACTGLHGANRLASNSLLECLTMAHLAVEALDRDGLPGLSPSAVTDTAGATPTLEPCGRSAAEHAGACTTIRRVLSRGAGVLRTHADMMSARRDLERLLALEWSPERCPDCRGVSHLARVAEAVLVAASRRIASCGCHQVVPGNGVSSP